MHLLLSAMLLNGTITVHARDSSQGLSGVYVQRIHNAPVNIFRGDLGFEAPADYIVHVTDPSCNATYGDMKTPIQGSIFLTAAAQKQMNGTLIMAGQLLGGGEGSGPMCGVGISPMLPAGLVAPPKLPGPHKTTRWTFHLGNVHDPMAGPDSIYDWDVNLTFTNT